MAHSSAFPRFATGTVIALAALLLYAIEGIHSPTASLLLSEVLQTAIVVWAAYCSLRVAGASRGHLKQLWMLLTAALILCSAAQAMRAYYQAFAHASPLTPWPSDILFILWVTPIAMMLLPYSNEDSAAIDWERVLDFAQVGVVALTAYLYFFYVPSRWEAEGLQMVLKVIRLQMFRDAALAAGFLAGAATGSNKSVRALFGRLATMFFLGGAYDLAFLVNPNASPARGRWIDLLWSAPFLYAAFFAATWRPQEEPAGGETKSRFQVIVVSQILPILMPLLVLFMGRRVAAEQITVAWIAVGASFVLSSLRLLLTNQRQRGIAETLSRTEQALRSSERMFFTAFRSGPDAVGISSLPGSEFLEVNDGFTRLTGYTRAETLGRTPVEMNLWVDAPRRAEIMSKLQEKGEVRDEEFYCRTKNGEPRICLFSGTLMQLDERPCALVIVRDITVNKRAEEALRASEERFRNLVQDLHVGVVLLGPDLTIQFANRAALTMFGTTWEEAFGRKSAEYNRTTIQEDGVEIPPSLLPGPRAVATKQPVRNEVVGWRSGDSGEVLWTQVDAVPHLTSEGSVESVVLSISNITQRMQAEEALRTSEGRFRTLVREMSVGIVLHGPEAEIQYANQAALKMFEVSSEEVRGKTSAALELIAFREDGSEIPFSMRPAPRVIRTGQTIKDEVVGWRRPGSAKVLWTLGNVVPLWSREGTILGVISTFTDITERQRTEDALHQLSTRLLQLQDEERRRLGRELHDSLAQSVLAVNLKLAQAMQASDSASESSRNALEEARRQLQEMSQEIRTLSYLLHPPLLDELGLVSAIKEYAEGFSERSGIRLDLDFPSDFGRLPEETETALFRIVQESLSNIQRHSGSETATISLRSEVGCSKLEVRDRGKGMEINRTDEASTRARLGVGILGMRERMAQLGGKLEIESGPSGTTVRATIPLRGQAPDAGSYSGRR